MSETFTKDSKGVVDNLDQLRPEEESLNNKDPHKMVAFTHFITLNISTRHKVMAKHVNVLTRELIRGKFQWEELSQKEQYHFWLYKLTKFTLWMLDNDSKFQFHFFFEATKQGNIHVHGRILCDDKKFIPHHKELRLFLHSIFEIPIQHKPFTDIKPYNSKLWGDYHTKSSKTYQTTSFKHYSNIE